MRTVFNVGGLDGKSGAGLSQKHRESVEPNTQRTEKRADSFALLKFGE